jgi:hypothetical protein
MASMFMIPKAFEGQQNTVAWNTAGSQMALSSILIDPDYILAIL